MCQICNECGTECDAVVEDHGIGSYEFWGSREVHHDYVEVSPCCGSDLVEGGNTVLRNSVHVARRDHKKGEIKQGEKYRLVVTRCWRKNGPRWIKSSKIKLKNHPKQEV